MITHHNVDQVGEGEGVNERPDSPAVSLWVDGAGRRADGRTPRALLGGRRPAPDDNNYATMPTTMKPIPTKKPTKKDITAAAAKPPPPAAAAAPTFFFVNATDPLTDNYYADRVYDYVDMVFCINGMMQKGESQV